jgi:alpha-glucosidase
MNEEAGNPVGDTGTHDPEGAPLATGWWRSAAIYQIYPRSFADGNGDGIGDLAGIRAHLNYLSDLGIDAIWFNPWYASPMADAGYDVASYREIDPIFGTLGEAEALIREAHDLGIRIIVDIVPNHTSDANPWFKEALEAGPGAAVRDLFWFRPGRGENGVLPPNNWASIFGGPAWTRTKNPDGTAGEWYLHLFAPGQPDFNWESPKVREDFEDVLRFWFDRGADGVRIDSAALLIKDPTLSDFDPENPPTPHPFEDRDAVHDVYRSWRRIAESYSEPRALIGEVWLPEDPDRFVLYLRPDELHTSFNFDFLGCPWDASAMRKVINDGIALHAPVNAPPTWLFSNHDVIRHVTRFGREDTRFSLDYRQFDAFSDIELGTRRARAAVLLLLALPGSLYIYQGEELGLYEVIDIPAEMRQDPMFFQTNGVNLGRDGCRVPLPWSGDEPPFGFSPGDATGAPWLPQPADWKDFTVAHELGDPDSMLELYRSALHLRRDTTSFGDGPMTWLPSSPEVLVFGRGDAASGDSVVCAVNLSAEAVDLPEHTEIILASGPLIDGKLGTDTAVWLRTA